MEIVNKQTIVSNHQISLDKDDTRLGTNFVGNFNITADYTWRGYELTDSIVIKSKTPNLRSNEHLFFKTTDSKFLNVWEED